MYTFTWKQLLALASLLMILSGTFYNLVTNSPVEKCMTSYELAQRQLSKNNDRILENEKDIAVLKQSSARIQKTIDQMSEKIDRILEIVIKNQRGVK